MPVCSPTCGTKAHCEYNLSGNRCVCDPGTTGNPYEKCDIQDEHRASCETSNCGSGAQCKIQLDKVQCLCPPGFTGNPYVECHGKN